MAAASARPADKKPGSFAVIAGTVFRDSGLSLAGAQLELTASGDSKEARKIKKMQAASDTRGEFAFRVPALAMRYRLSVKAPGYVPEVKEVAISADERVDVFFQLQPASNQ